MKKAHIRQCKYKLIKRTDYIQNAKDIQLPKADLVLFIR